MAAVVLSRQFFEKLAKPSETVSDSDAPILADD
jgi:hypothetical protein